MITPISLMVPFNPPYKACLIAPHAGLFPSCHSLFSYLFPILWSWYKVNLLIDIFLEIMGGYSQYYKVKQMKQPNESFYKHLIISFNINCKAILLDLLEKICMLGASEYSDLEFSKLIISYKSWIEPPSDSSLNDRSDP